MESEERWGREWRGEVEEEMRIRKGSSRMRFISLTWRETLWRARLSLTNHGRARRMESRRNRRNKKDCAPRRGFICHFGPALFLYFYYIPCFRSHITAVAVVRRIIFRERTYKVPIRTNTRVNTYYNNTFMCIQKKKSVLTCEQHSHTHTVFVL